ncbi:MAG: PhoPQ-activated pathogenicity-related family protein [Armatimonadetes bacterium]|nr:PhoPQ-activated pathogenicity-related family protein [Armatimonadota bacterium]
MQHTRSYVPVFLRRFVQCFLACLVAVGCLADEPLLISLGRGWDVGNSATLRPRVRAIGTVFTSRGELVLHRVRFYSHQSKKGPVNIFGYLGVPIGARSRPAPGLVVVHGGGGYADIQRAIDGASRGFVTLSIDLPGKGPQRERSRSTGPDMTVTNIFSVANPAENYLVHAVRATRRAITFLHTRPEVDPKRIGVVGVSWGGVISLLTAATDPRVKAVVDTFGAGNIDKWSVWLDFLARLEEEDIDYFRQHLDPMSYVGNLQKPLFVVGTTNDNCYWLPALTSTFEAVGGKRWLLLRPNLSHRIDDAARRAIWRWLMLQLGGNAEALERGVACAIAESDSALKVRIFLRGRVTPKRLELAWSVHNSGWEQRLWHLRELIVRPGKDPVCTLPALAHPINVFVTAYYGDGLALSSSVHSVWRLVYGGETQWVDVPCLSPGKHLVPAGLLEGRFFLPACFLPHTYGDGARRIDGVWYVPVREAATRLGFDTEYTTGAVRLYRTAPRTAFRQPSG